MLGEKLRQHRKRFGYTLQELSQKTNLSVGYLSNIERDAASPTIATLDILCNALRVDIVELLKADRSPSPLVRLTPRGRCVTESSKTEALRAEVVTCRSLQLRNGQLRTSWLSAGDSALCGCLRAAVHEAPAASGLRG